MDDITAVVKDENGDTIREVTTSIADYCNAIINSETTEVITEELKDLAKSTLDYGKAASQFFDYNTAAFDGIAQQITEAPTLPTITGNWYNNGMFTLEEVTYRATSVPELRFYISNVSESYLADVNKNINSTNGTTAQFVKLDDGRMMLSVKNIDITKFDEQFVVSAGDATILTFTANSWVKAAMTKGGKTGALGTAIANYYLMSEAYFV
jgi:hypothetical protein